MVFKTYNRKSPRAKFHNYSGGDYFITICCADKNQYFGRIIDNTMKFTKIGQIANDYLANLSSHYSYADVLLFVIMPNHIHAIIRIITAIDTSTNIPAIRTLLGIVIGGYKQAVTNYARRNDIEFGWQSRYHDHIIRGAKDGTRIAEYIENNIGRWNQDCFYTTNQIN